MNEPEKPCCTLHRKTLVWVIEGLEQSVSAEKLEARRKIADALLGIQWYTGTQGFIVLEGVGYEETVKISIGKEVKFESPDDPDLNRIVAQLGKELRDKIQDVEKEPEPEPCYESEDEPEEV